MILVFIDETTDSKFKDYLGFSIATINARFYPYLKEEAQRIIKNIGWDPEVEFKGSYLFSKSQGCTEVEIEKRIDAAKKLLELNVAKKNSRMSFYFGAMKSENFKSDYLKHLPELLYRSLPTAPSGAGKNLLSIHFDERTDITQDELHNTFLPIIHKRKYVLLERISKSKSIFDTVGIMYADLVGYLAGRKETISNDAELFEGLTKEQLENNGKIKKLKSSTELIGLIKKLNLFINTSKPA